MQINQPKTLVMTKTGEPYQPVRVYYQVLNQKTLLGVFQKLRCMNLSPNRTRWEWLYDQEARKIRFERSYNSVPKSDRPLVLGYFTFPNPQEMWLDLRSFDRAAIAVEFFGKRINPRVAKATHLRVVNRCFDQQEMPNQSIHPSLDIFFNRDDVVPAKSKEMEARIQEIAEEYANDPEARTAAISEYLDTLAKQPAPEIEEISITFYEDGIAPLSMALKFRQIEAYEHWSGNTSFTQYDVLQRFAAALGQADEDFDDEAEE